MTTSVVLLHGGGTSARQWDLADRLGRRVRRVILLAAPVTVDGGTGMDCMKPRLRTAWGTSLTDEQTAFVTHPCRWVSDTISFYDEPLDWSAVRELPLYLRPDGP